MMIWPKYSSSPSIFTRRSMASLIDSSRPLWTLTTYQRLFAETGSPGSWSAAVGGCGGDGGSAPDDGSSGLPCIAACAAAVVEAAPGEDVSRSGGSGEAGVCGSIVANSSGMGQTLPGGWRPQAVSRHQSN